MCERLVENKINISYTCKAYGTCGRWKQKL